MNADQAWRGLVKAARTAPPEIPAEAPHGFSSRVVAHWREDWREPLAPVWALFARRAVLGACLLLAAATALNLRTLSGQWLADLRGTEPMLEVLIRL